MKSSFLYTQAWDYLYEEGVVSTAGWRGPLLRIRAVQGWSEVRLLRHELRVWVVYDRDHGSVITYHSDRFVVTSANGRSVKFAIGQTPERTLASDYFRFGVRSDTEPMNIAAAQVVSAVQRKVAEAQLPMLRKELDAGRSADFGALSATRDEIRGGGDVFRWHDVTGIKFTAPWPSDDEVKSRDMARSEAVVRLSGKTASGSSKNVVLQAGEVHNLATLRELWRQFSEQR